MYQIDSTIEEYRSIRVSHKTHTELKAKAALCECSMADLADSILRDGLAQIQGPFPSDYTSSDGEKARQGA